MQLRLKQDIIIPAGTVFGTAPRKVERNPDVFAEATIALTADTYGSITCLVGGPDSDERHQLQDFFEPI